MKRLSSFFSIAVVLLALTGCSGSDTAKTPQNATGVTDGEVAATGNGDSEPGNAATEDLADPAVATGDDARTPATSSDLVKSGEIQRLSVRIYFPAASEDGLIGELHEILETKSPGDRVKQIVADLIEGPQGKSALMALPRGTSLRQVYVLESGVAYLDFSSELSSGLGGGSSRELLTLYSIIDSVVLNVSEVRRVGLLVGGRPIDSLNGHLDLRRPLGANRDLILKG